jgi:hypothetical protein
MGVFLIPATFAKGQMLMFRIRMPAASILAAAVSGCMGSAMPDVAALTKPTEAAFATLAAWRPWQSAPPDPAVVATAPVEAMPLAPPVQANQVITPAVVVAPIERPKVRHRQAPTLPKIVPAPMSSAPATAPASVTCTTATTPAGRVQMRCLPFD